MWSCFLVPKSQAAAFWTNCKPVACYAIPWFDKMIRRTELSLTNIQLWNRALTKIPYTLKYLIFTAWHFYFFYPLISLGVFSIKELGEHLLKVDGRLDSTVIFFFLPVLTSSQSHRCAGWPLQPNSFPCLPLLFTTECSDFTTSRLHNETCLCCWQLGTMGLFQGGFIHRRDAGKPPYAFAACAFSGCLSSGWSVWAWQISASWLSYPYCWLCLSLDSAFLLCARYRICWWNTGVCCRAFVTVIQICLKLMSKGVLSSSITTSCLLFALYLSEE